VGIPGDLARAARRNPGYAPDPYTIDVAPLAPVQRDPNKIIAEPLAGQLRAFAGLFQTGDTRSSRSRCGCA
jgi:hypothetical protein